MTGVQLSCAHLEQHPIRSAQKARVEKARAPMARAPMAGAPMASVLMEYAAMACAGMVLAQTTNDQLERLSWILHACKACTNAAPRLLRVQTCD